MTVQSRIFSCEALAFNDCDVHLPGIDPELRRREQNLQDYMEFIISEQSVSWRSDKKQISNLSTAQGDAVSLTGLRG